MDYRSISCFLIPIHPNLRAASAAVRVRTDVNSSQLLSKAVPKHDLLVGMYLEFFASALKVSPIIVLLF